MRSGRGYVAAFGSTTFAFAGDIFELQGGVGTEIVQVEKVIISATLNIELRFNVQTSLAVGGAPVATSLTRFDKTDPGPTNQLARVFTAAPVQGVAWDGRLVIPLFASTISTPTMISFTELLGQPVLLQAATDTFTINKPAAGATDVTAAVYYTVI